VLVLEREPEFYGNARAVYTDDECMRIFQSCGIAEELAAEMLTDCPVQMLLPDGSVLMQIADSRRPFGWPPLNFFYQPYLETRLAEALGRYPNVRVMRGRETTRFEHDRDGVIIHHGASEGSRYGRSASEQRASSTNPVNASVRARYFVGCDGGRSAVRTQLGIRMAGKSFPNPCLSSTSGRRNAIPRCITCPTSVSSATRRARRSAVCSRTVTIASSSC